MKKYYMLSRGVCISALAVVIIFIVGVYFSSGIKSFNKAQQSGIPKPITINNRTHALEVVKIESKENTLHLSLKNNYNKAITAYAISPGDYYVSTELIGTDEVIPPGAMRIAKYNLPDTVDSSSNPQNQQIAITILAVVFDDKTGDGDPKMLRMIRDARKGEREEIIRFLPILESLLNAEDNLLAQVIESGKDSIRQLPNRHQQARSFEVRAAAKDARDLVLYRLEEIEAVRSDQGNGTFRERLIKLKAHYEKKLSKL
jgi:hypothetical protein